MPALSIKNDFEISTPDFTHLCRGERILGSADICLNTAAPFNLLSIKEYYALLAAGGALIAYPVREYTALYRSAAYA